MKYHFVIVGYNQVINNKYMPILNETIKSGHINGYSVIDLNINKEKIKRMLHKNYIKPKHEYYLNVSPNATEQSLEKFNEFINYIRFEENLPLKVYIGTEAKAHYRYLKYCVENNISSLTEKPLFIPMKNGKFIPENIMIDFQKILSNCADYSKHSVMTLGRYHKIYNDKFIKPVYIKAMNMKAPVTSFHFRHNGGVWNLQNDYNTREDHPYKYGYGMLMHGAYHYIDISSQILLINKKLFPDKKLSLKVKSYFASPIDQSIRMSKIYSKKIKDNDPNWAKNNASNNYGETDIVSILRMVDKNTGRTIMLGSLSMEQTTPSIRNWNQFPPGLYNKNGRVSSCDTEAQLSTLYACQVQCYDVPNKKELDNKDRIPSVARITERGNAAINDDLEYLKIRNYKNIHHSDSNKILLKKWLFDQEKRSTINLHVLPMKMIQAMAISAYENKEVEFEL